MVAQFTTEIQSSIVHSYTDFDGVQVDVMEITYPDGTSETRQCWTEETLDEPTYILKTAKGNTIKSSWSSSWNNKWLNSYRQLYLQRAYDLAKLQDELSRDSKEQEEIELDRYQQAKADLGFTW